MFLKSGQRSLIFESGTIRKIVYGFLLLSCSNIVPKRTVFEIFDFKTAVTLKTGLGSVKAIASETVVGYSTWVRCVVSINIMHFNEFEYLFACRPKDVQL